MFSALESSHERVADFHLLGVVPLEDCLILQRRLVYELTGHSQARAVVLLAEHPNLITVGKSGSRLHLRLPLGDRQQLAVRWVDRSGGCILHEPGQLAIYAIVPLTPFGLTRKSHQVRVRSSVAQALHANGITAQARSDSFDLWGRTGLLAAMAVAFRHDIAMHGAFVNVAPCLARYGYVDTAAAYRGQHERATMSSLLAERRLPVRMSSVRAAFIESFAAVLQCDRHNIHTGHPWLPRTSTNHRESSARAS